MQVFRLAILVLSGLLGLSGPVVASTLAELRAVQDALDSARSDYARRAPHLSAAETSDYDAYIGRLRDRLAVACAAYSLSTSQVPGDIQCPQSAPARLAPADINLNNEATRSEATATLDAELDAGLGEFDERLLREQQRVKAAAPRTGSGTGRGGQVGAGDGPPGSDEMATATDASRPESSAESVTDSAAGDPGQEQVASGRPADLPDGSDDDVVARQLREAAEKETDPELKAKLWEEYRNYKQGTR